VDFAWHGLVKAADSEKRRNAWHELENVGALFDVLVADRGVEELGLVD